MEQIIKRTGFTTVAGLIHILQELDGQHMIYVLDAQGNELTVVEEVEKTLSDKSTVTDIRIIAAKQ